MSWKIEGYITTRRRKATFEREDLTMSRLLAAIEDASNRGHAYIKIRRVR